MKKVEENTEAGMAELAARNEDLEAEVRRQAGRAEEKDHVIQALQRRVAQLEKNVSPQPWGVGTWSPELGLSIYVNDALAEIFGLPRYSRLPSKSASSVAEGAEKDLEEAVPTNESDPAIASVEQLLQGVFSENKPIFGYELAIAPHVRGECRLVADAVPWVDNSGDIQGAIASIQGFANGGSAGEKSLSTNCGRLEKEKLESLRLLAGGIAHDFNNLLTGILGNSSLARLELPPEHASIRRALDNLEEGALRASDLCRQMLVYASRGKITPEPLALSALVKDTLDLLELSVGKTVSLRLGELATDVPLLNGDSAQIRQMLLNLVQNASDAIGSRRGEVVIRTGTRQLTRDDFSRFAFNEFVAEGVYAYLEVNDNGTGIGAEKLSHIFDPFFTTKFTGRGLGLAQVLGAVRSHQGAIEVATALGQGTTFRIYFPAIGSLASDST